MIAGHMTTQLEREDVHSGPTGVGDADTATDARPAERGESQLPQQPQAQPSLTRLDSSIVAAAEAGARRLLFVQKHTNSLPKQNSRRGRKTKLTADVMRVPCVCPTYVRTTAVPSLMPMQA